MPAAGVRRRFLEHERERPRGITHGDLCRLAHFYVVSLEAMTRRLEELRLVPAGTWDRLRQEKFRVDEAKRLLGIESPARADDDTFSPRYIALAVEAWQQGEVSEGQLAQILHTDRIGARERVERFALAANDGSDQGSLVNFGAPLFGSSNR
jgi:Zn-dependent peptidase ImmA (M78 family)